MNKKILSMFITFVLIFSSTSSLAAYSDVSEDDLQSYGIEYVDMFDDQYGTNILSGFPDGSFRPYDSLTREQVAKIFVEYIGHNPYNYYPEFFTYFWDMTNDRWSYDYVLQLSSLDIVNGYPGGYFDPERPITRAEFVQMLYALQFHFTKDYTWFHYHYWNNLVYYGDISNHWAEKQIRVMTSVMEVDYYSSFSSYFYPDYEITRIEAAYMLAMMMQFNLVHYNYVPIN